MTVVVNAAQLRRQMARRGLSATELARAAKLSPPTISAALAGRPISATSFSLIGKALMRLPAVDVLDSLLLSDHEDRGLA
jgi:transcriptional regulator with XRE-family HTH domain